MKKTLDGKQRAAGEKEENGNGGPTALHLDILFHKNELIGRPGSGGIIAHSRSRAANSVRNALKFRVPQAPTDEQRAAIDLFGGGGSLRIDAHAGTGKTSTLRLLAESTSRKGHYLTVGPHCFSSVHKDGGPRTWRAWNAQAA